MATATIATGPETPAAAQSRALTAMALAVVMERLARLSAEARSDLRELLKALDDAETAEEVEEVRVAILEVLDPPPFGVHPLPDAGPPGPEEVEFDRRTAALVKAAREAAGLTVAQLSERAGLPPGYLAELEAAEAPVVTDLVRRKLGAALGVAPESLDPWADRPGPPPAP